MNCIHNITPGGGGGHSRAQGRVTGMITKVLTSLRESEFVLLEIPRLTRDT